MSIKTRQKEHLLTNQSLPDPPSWELKASERKKVLGVGIGILNPLGEILTSLSRAATTPTFTARFSQTGMLKLVLDARLTPNTLEK